MRLWSLHPRYLDAKGLVALWREALLAQAVLKGLTRGYTQHPQLFRFRESGNPKLAIAQYLHVVHDEAERRGYHFDRRKIGRIAVAGNRVPPMIVTRGQLRYEWNHLRAKLSQRAPQLLESLPGVLRVEPHPLFRVVPGPVAQWERILL